MEVLQQQEHKHTIAMTSIQHELFWRWRTVDLEPLDI